MNLTQVKAELDELKAQETTIKNRRKVLESSVLAEFDTAIAEEYKLKPEPFGTVRVTAGNLKLKIERKKKVEWSAAELETVYGQITADGGDATKFIDRTVEFNIPEHRYTGWSADVQKWFDAARTVKGGGTTMVIELPDDE